MYYVYILKSKLKPGAIYKGFTTNLRERLAQHNSQKNKGYSKLYAPWDIEAYLAFSDISKAKKFEEYLKSSSGSAFTNKHFLSDDFKRALIKFREINRGKRNSQSE